jgi:hypothetical protein
MIVNLVTIILFLVKYDGIRFWLGGNWDKYTANKGRNFCDMMYKYEIKIK